MPMNCGSSQTHASTGFLCKCCSLFIFLTRDQVHKLVHVWGLASLLGSGQCGVGLAGGRGQRWLMGQLHPLIEFWWDSGGGNNLHITLLLYSMSLLISCLTHSLICSSHVTYSWNFLIPLSSFSLCLCPYSIVLLFCKP